jgi:hypothetical protein
VTNERRNAKALRMAGASGREATDRYERWPPDRQGTLRSGLEKATGPRVMGGQARTDHPTGGPDVLGERLGPVLRAYRPRELGYVRNRTPMADRDPS